MSSKMSQLADLGQSIWFDYISRDLIESGKLKSMIADGLRGMTSNPSIFMNAIAKSNDYDKAIVEMSGRGKSSFEIYDALTVKDVAEAADQFRSVYDVTNGLDGYVSLEINPQLADTIEEQAQEGLRLAKELNRPNVMIKVPSTPAGCKVVEKLISQGVNVNVTLIFSLEQYIRVAKAYIAGLKTFQSNGGDISKVHSVASAFVSRVDASVDKQIDAESINELKTLKGEIAVANCAKIFAEYEKIFNGSDFASLKEAGANSQRVLWASTGTKNPDYNDVLYVEQLIANPSVNTLPEKTLNAFLDHGEVAITLPQSDSTYQDILNKCDANGVDITQTCEDLQLAGCEAFVQSFEELLMAIEEKAKALVG